VLSFPLQNQSITFESGYDASLGPEFPDGHKLALVLLNPTILSQSSECKGKSLAVVLASVVFNCHHLGLVQLKRLETEVLEVMVVPSQNLNPHPAGTCTNQDVAHQIIEDSAL
jgi:hypothetical protein